MMYESGLTLITCTGNRPKAFDLCQHYVRRQDWKGPLQWIIVDDGESAYRRAMPQPSGTLMTRIFPTPLWYSGQNTLARNICVAIPEVVYDKVLFVEDDDWYSSSYVSEMANCLGFTDIVGETRAHYYHIPTKRYRILDNLSHASLCQTGIRSSLLPLVQQICNERKNSFIDVRLWENFRGSRSLRRTVNCIGIKGLPGRAGIGIGHRPLLGGGWSTDIDNSVLKSWIGEDYRLY